jgi:hydroxymethylglutaryl-CoA lyase
VTIREVGPRDGLQAEQPLPIEDRVRLIEALSACGSPEIEAVSFVSPRAVPAMAGAAEVWARVRKASGVRYSALVPNRRGAEAAVGVDGFDYLQGFIGAVDGYNLKNVGKTVEESLLDIADVVEVGRSAGLPVEVTVSASFGDPYQGQVLPERVAEVGTRLVDLGAAGLSFGDTAGMATPSLVRDVVGLLRDRLPGIRLNLHFHDHRGTAMANVLVALGLGCDDFDASVGGIGGSPFAPGVGGNVPTEDLVYVLGAMGIETGVQLDRVIEATHLVESLIGHPVPGKAAHAYPISGAPRGPVTPS